ncbi:MAG: HAMP domain-containing protein [Candidatus Pacebacteria bacterium]|nr:HAMP domain-containing protein [Candidatus Paceibacterota bacterium]
MARNKIFSKIFGLIMVTSLVAGMVFLLVTFQDSVRSAEKAIIQENKLLAETTANMIVAGYLNSQWPFQTLKLISDSENIVFLWVVKPSGEIYFADDPALFGKVIRDDSFLSVDQPEVKDMLSEDGEKMKLFIHPLEMEPGEKPWMLYLGASLKPREAAVRRIITIDIIAVVSNAFLIGLISFYFSRRITRPLQRLGEGAEIIGRGDLKHRINIKTGDEIEELARSFNKMADDLKKSRADLEESKDVLEIKVKARTRELQELNKNLEEKVCERTKELQDRLDELERSHRLMINRELKMIELKKELKEKEKESSNSKTKI